MAESFLFDIAVNIIEKLSSSAVQPVVSVWGLETDLEKMKDALLAIKAVLSDAEQQQVHSQRVQLWLGRLKEVLYDAEDLLDDVEYEVLRRQVVTTGRKVRRFFSRSNPIVFRFRIAYKVKKIRERMVDIAADKSNFGLTEGGNNNDRQVIISGREMTHSFVDAATVIGRDVDKKKILDQLLNVADDGENISILPIVGMGGLGKTTLAKLVYNDERVTRHFQEKVWVCVSNDFGVQNVLSKIMETASTTQEKYTDMNIEGLQKLLRGTFKDKKFLLVLDDVWSEDPGKWRELKSLLSAAKGANGSWIVVTTRNNQVATIMGSVEPYNLSYLVHEHCLSLFFKCAFKDEQDQERYPNLQKTGEDIVKKCKGVPLAVVTLGYLLLSSTDEHYWECIRDSDIWNLKQTEKNSIFPALKLSYEQLPYHLKRCFAYCSFFPKNYAYTDYQLIQFWMAHGLLQPENDKEDLEDTGRRCLKELWSRSFFHDLDESFGVIRVRMHDLMHELATSLTQNECSIITSVAKQNTSSVCARHLLFDDPTVLSDSVPLTQSLKRLDCVRSIALRVDQKGLSSQSIVGFRLSRFLHLRWLNLSYSEIETLPEEITRLKHLRFLDLRYSTIERLPHSLYRLQNLQTLLLGGCEKLEELPAGIRRLINLRSLQITTKQMYLPKNDIGCLKSLRFLLVGDSENLKRLFEDMKGLTNLRTLIIWRCTRLVCLPPSIKYLTALENLYIGDCGNLDLKMEQQGRDPEDHCNQWRLQKMILYELPKLVDLPQWLLQGSTIRLQFLRLESCRCLKELNACPASLQELQIKECDELTKRCKYETGEDWSKIAHVRKIVVNGNNIRSTDDR